KKKLVSQKLFLINLKSDAWFLSCGETNVLELRFGLAVNHLLSPSIFETGLLFVKTDTFSYKMRFLDVFNNIFRTEHQKNLTLVSLES
ncbi:hypothetical protein BpHYR1_045498, partial [Brachionus plicatilis]